MRVNFQWSFTMWADLSVLVELSQVAFTFGTFLSGTLTVFCLLVCLFFPNSIWCSLLSSCMDPSLNFPWGPFQGPRCLYALWLTSSHTHILPHPTTVITTTWRPQNPLSLPLFHFMDPNQARPTLSQWKLPAPGCPFLLLGLSPGPSSAFLPVSSVTTEPSSLSPPPFLPKTSLALFHPGDGPLSSHCAGATSPVFHFLLILGPPQLWPAYG